MMPLFVLRIGFWIARHSTLTIQINQSSYWTDDGEGKAATKACTVQLWQSAGSVCPVWPGGPGFV